ncbi:VOC family protein [Catenulispora rubra]|uniref:VOC family protein n=1 Tax=Catenulispora rubra TaxID=280293 RepID=UPI001891FEAD|nr:VOC family protein [Catenulispora rubra]
MDAFYPQPPVGRSAESFRFYNAVLPELIDAKLVKGDENGPYAFWEVNEQAAAVLSDRGMWAEAVGAVDLPVEGALDLAVEGALDLPAEGPPSQDWVMLVSRVDDVDAVFALCLRSGGTAAAGPTDRPDWGPNLRSAHVRDPEGHLVELQSY